MGIIGTVLGGIARTHVSPAQTGLVVGGAAAAWSLRPSLLPRDQPTQSGVSIGAFAAGFGVGAGANQLLSTGTRIALRGRAGSQAVTLARLGILGVGAGVGVLALPRKLKHDLPFSNTLESAGRIALVAGLGSLAAQTHMYALERLARSPAQRGMLNAALVGAELVGLGAFLEQRRRRFAKSDPTTPAAQTALVAGAAVAGTYLAMRGEGTVVSRLISRFSGAKPWQVHAGFAGLAGIAGLGAAWKVTHGAASKPLVVEQARAGAVGPGADGPHEFDTLDDAGVRLMQGVQTANEIEAVTKRAGAVDPIRVAIGLRSADSPKARAELALKRLRENGAFDRGNIFVAVSPGAGMIDDQLPASVELMANGDVATVAIPYSNRASFLSLDRIDDGAETVAALLDGIKRENTTRKAQGRKVPRVLMYGNSLGAWSGQEAFQGAGVAGVTDKVDRVLWVGNPGPSGWRRDVLMAEPGKQDPGRARVREYSDVGELDALSLKEREGTAIWMHTRASDPVAKIDVDMLWRRPLYLRAEHRADARVPHNAAYVPGVSFLQEFGDILTTSRIADDVDRQAEGHTYVVDIVPDTAAAFFPGERDHALLERIQSTVTAQSLRLRTERRAQTGA